MFIRMKIMFFSFSKSYLQGSVLILLCWCLCANLAAQQPVIDSLERVLATGTVAGEEKAILFVQLSNAYLLVDTAKSRAHAMQALQLAQSSRSRLAEARAYKALANIYSRNFLHFRAHDYHSRAEKIFIELGDMDALYLHYNSLMASFYTLREIDNAAYYAEKVRVMSAERKDWNSNLTAQFILGYYHFRENIELNRFEQEVLDYFFNLYHKALQINDSLNAVLPITITLAGEVGRIYMEMRRYSEALPLLHKVRSYNLQNNIMRNMIYIYRQLALLHANIHNIDSATYYIDKALNSQITNDVTLAFLYRTIAFVDSIKGDYLSALTYFQKFHNITFEFQREQLTTERARLRFRSEFEQMELEKRIIQQEHQKQQRLVLILTITLFITFALLAMVIFFYRKITDNNREMKNMNRELKEMHTTKDKLFSVVAHDLRNPVSSLVGLLRLLGAQKMDAEEQDMLFKNVSGRVDNVYNLLDNLLRWSKSQMQGIVPAPVLFDVHEESRLVIDNLQAIAANKQIILENHIQQYQVYTDRDMFAVLVRNLINNAIKYTSAEGKIILASEISDDSLIISVKDNGIGMPQEVQDTLFSLSETQSRYGTENESGTGLGLVVCADFVKANGGKIWFTSAQDEGSTFFFSVPLRT